MTKRLEMRGEIGGDVLGDTIAEILLLGIVAHVDKGQARRWRVCPVTAGTLACCVLGVRCSEKEQEISHGDGGTGNEEPAPLLPLSSGQAQPL